MESYIIRYNKSFSTVKVLIEATGAHFADAIYNMYLAVNEYWKQQKARN
jgi:hypothetical protein